MPTKGTRKALNDYKWRQHNSEEDCKDNMKLYCARPVFFAVTLSSRK